MKVRIGYGFGTGTRLNDGGFGEVVDTLERLRFDSLWLSERIGGATVTSERSIDLVLNGGERWRMGFKADCPALSYYQGFYYRQTQAGRLCAGRDAVLARSGAECPIESLARIKTDKKRR